MDKTCSDSGIVLTNHRLSERTPFEPYIILIKHVERGAPTVLSSGLGRGAIVPGPHGLMGEYACITICMYTYMYIYIYIIYIYIYTYIYTYIYRTIRFFIYDIVMHVSE